MILSGVKTMLGWVKTMTWKELRPIAHLSEKAYKKGISLTKMEKEVPSSIKCIYKRWMPENPSTWISQGIYSSHL